MKKIDNIIEFPRNTKSMPPEEIEVMIFDCGHTSGHLVDDGGVRCATCFTVVANIMWRVHTSPLID